jgi:hypothetical protein
MFFANNFHASTNNVPATIQSLPEVDKLYTESAGTSNQDVVSTYAVKKACFSQITAIY